MGQIFSFNVFLWLHFKNSAYVKQKHNFFSKKKKVKFCLIYFCILCLFFFFEEMLKKELRAHKFVKTFCLINRPVVFWFISFVAIDLLLQLLLLLLTVLFDHLVSWLVVSMRLFAQFFDTAEVSAATVEELMLIVNVLIVVIAVLLVLYGDDDSDDSFC